MSFLSEAWDGVKESFSSTYNEKVEDIKLNAKHGVSDWFSRVTSKLIAKPDVQREIKATAGQKLGVSILDNWKYIVAGVAGLIILAIATRKKW